METQYSSSLHIAMCPWFAFGHMTQYLYISNKLAQKGHKISFFVPKNTQSKLQHLNLFPNLITFVPIIVPRVDGLPPAAETTSDVPKPLFPLVMTAMDRAEPDFELLLRGLRPHLVFYDLAHWIPSLARRIGIKSVHFSIINAATIGYNVPPDRDLGEEEEEGEPPLGYPDPSYRVPLHVARGYAEMRRTRFGSGVLFFDRIFTSVRDSDALAFKGCIEIDGAEFAGFLQKRFGKPMFQVGPVIPVAGPAADTLPEEWEAWLGSFEPRSVVYCALGSEWIMEGAQFRELLSGLELSGFPFLAAVRPPPESPTESLERGRVHTGWIQQQTILAHPSVGCFVTHCGSASLAEALVNPCQLVMVPHIGDHYFQARIIGTRLKAGLEVERDEEDGSFSGESLCKAIRTVMDEGESNEVGREIRANRAKLQKLLLNKDLEAGYIDDFNLRLHNLVRASKLNTHMY